MQPIYIPMGTPITVIAPKQVRKPQAHNPINWAWRPNNGPVQNPNRKRFTRDPVTGEMHLSF